MKKKRTQTRRESGKHKTLPYSGETFPRLRRDTLEFILEGVPEGQRAVRLFQAAADCVRCDWSDSAIFSLLPDAARRTGLEIYEIEKQIFAGIHSEKGTVECLS